MVSVRGVCLLAGLWLGLALGCGGAPAEPATGMPSTVCMTPDNRCPPASPHASRRARGPVERAVEEHPDDAAGICERALADFDTHAQAVDRACRTDSDCVLLDVGYCGTLARRGTSARELFERWNDYRRACHGGEVECVSYEAVCTRGRCEFAPPLRG